MSDQFLDRLRQADPAAQAQPDVHSLRARVFAHVDDNVITLSPRNTRVRYLRYAAAVVAFAVVGGGGYWGGSLSHQPSPLPSAPMTTEAKIAPGLGLGGGGGVTSNVTAGDSSRGGPASSYIAWYGNTILKPAATIPNVAGSEIAYRFTTDGLDRMALGRALAVAVGLDPDKVREGTTGIEYVLTENGNSNLQVDNQTQAGFWANNWDRNPYACDQQMSPSEPTSKTNVQATADQCNAEWPAPTKTVAEQQARRAIESLGLPMLKGAIYSSSIGDSRMVNVQVTPVVDGFTLGGTTLWVQVAKQGVFGLNGFGAHLEKATTYPIAGARDVANRSQLRKWAAFGPVNVTPQTEPIVYNEESGATPTTQKRDGRLMVQAQLAEIDVTQAAHALQQQWFPGGEILFLPAWNFTATDGSIWQMLAISEDYVDWQVQFANGPIAYAARATESTGKTAP